MKARTRRQPQPAARIALRPGGIAAASIMGWGLLATPLGPWAPAAIADTFDTCDLAVTPDRDAVLPFTEPHTITLSLTGGATEGMGIRYKLFDRSESGAWVVVDEGDRSFLSAHVSFDIPAPHRPAGYVLGWYTPEFPECWGQAEVDWIDPADYDADGDSIPDGADNCDEVANLEQADTDNDNPGELCDDSSTGDSGNPKGQPGGQGSDSPDAGSVAPSPGPVDLDSSDPPAPTVDRDSDGDGLLDGVEVSGQANRNYGYRRTDPHDRDSDNDGVGDGREILHTRTDPRDADTDRDQLDDGHEIRRTNHKYVSCRTNPLERDSDHDHLIDGREIRRHHTNPCVPDTDGDRISDSHEVRGPMPNRYAGCRTDPLLPDSDGDDLTDGSEARRHRTNPCARDTDRGGVRDGDEIHAGTDPLDPLNGPNTPWLHSPPRGYRS